MASGNSGCNMTQTIFRYIQGKPRVGSEPFGKRATFAQHLHNIGSTPLGSDPANTRRYDAGPTSCQHWANASCLLGSSHRKRECANVTTTYVSIHLSQGELICGRYVKICWRDNLSLSPEDKAKP